MRLMASANRKAASELWMVSIIVVLVLLVLLLFRREPDTAWLVRQKAQLHSMDAAIELFRHELGTYAPSDANDASGKAYCGTMKLAEAIMGRDLLGFHSNSIFRCDGLSAAGAMLYPPNIDQLPPSERVATLTVRKGPYLAAESANAWRLVDVYGKGNTGPFPEDVYVLCDTYVHKRPSGKKTGMPILYYRANPSGTTHEAGGPFNLYDDADNRALIALGVPGEPGKIHPLLDPKRFYLNTQNDRSSTPEPARRDFILVSAGWDGVYGTADDIYNFRWKYREK